jgi:ribonuclease P protein component
LSEVPHRKATNRGLAAFGWEKKLRKTDEFSSVFRFKCLQRGNCLDLYARPNDLAFPRLGLVVPKRILARAVDRNRVRRILREAFRLAQAGLGGLDVIFRLRPASPGAPCDYRAEGERLLRQAKRCAENRAH